VAVVVELLLVEQHLEVAVQVVMEMLMELLELLILVVVGAVLVKFVLVALVDQV
jgi:hypothetical protein